MCLRELIDGTFMLELCRLARAYEHFTLSILSCLGNRSKKSLSFSCSSSGRFMCLLFQPLFSIRIPKCLL